jgi:hypothetical protein
VVRGDGVRLGAVGRADVDGGAGEPPDVVEEVVLGEFGDLVGLADGQVGVEGDVELGVELVADPADADAVASPDDGNRSRLVLDLAGQGGSTASMRRR